MIASVEYVGDTGTHLNIRTNVNQPTQCILLNGCDPTNPANQSLAGRVARRPYKNFGQMILEDWSGVSNYNAMNVKVQRRSRDITGTIAYTWSKMMDIKSGAAAVTGDSGGAYGFQNFYCRQCDYARSDYDVGNRIAANLVYNLPFGQGERFGGTVGHGMDLLIGGWQLNLIGSIQGGFPFTLSAADACNGCNEANAERANLVGNPIPAGFVKGVKSWFSPTAFAEPAAGQFGNSERNFLRGPGIQTLDASAFKTIHTEHVDISLRFESFNVLNHPQFADPNATVSVQQGATFPANYPLGTISSTNSKVPHRENQGGVRITF